MAKVKPKHLLWPTALPIAQELPALAAVPKEHINTLSHRVDSIATAIAHCALSVGGGCLCGHFGPLGAVIIPCISLDSSLTIQGRPLATFV